MQTKRVCIDGMWCILNFFKDGEGIRVEVEQEVSGKRYNVFPDRIIKNE